MSYSVLILRRAQKELAELGGDEYRRVRNAIQDLGQEPRPMGYIRLTGRNGLRIRVGEYRVIYEVDDKLKNCNSFTHRSSPRHIQISR